MKNISLQGNHLIHTTFRDYVSLSGFTLRDESVRLAVGLQLDAHEGAAGEDITIVAYHARQILGRTRQIPTYLKLCIDRPGYTDNSLVDNFTRHQLLVSEQTS